MPCEYVSETDQLDAMRDLEEELGLSIQVFIDPATGSVALTGWDDASRRGLSDVCAIRKLMASNSFAFQQALSQAEAIAGRQMDQTMLAAGVHSHDGGHTWNAGH